MRDEERAEEKEEAREEEEEEEEEEEKKYEEEEEEEEEEKDDDDDDYEVDDDDDYEVDDDDDDDVDDDDDDYEVDDDDDDYEVDDDDDDVDDYDVGEILKKTKRKPATKIANQRRKRSPIRKTCCFAGAQGYSCRHKGDSNVRATRCVPESERNNFSEDAMCCNACYVHFKYSNVTCCFAGAQGYSCHKGDPNVRARNRVPESERKKFPEDAMCCDACYNHFKYLNVECCFAGAQGYSCHKGDSNGQARNRVPESERNKFPEDARCCDACCNHFKCSNVPCCFAGAQGYSCHKGDSNAQARKRVPESERNKFPEDAMCCDTCYNHFKCSNVTCCFAGAQGYSCHKGNPNVRARRSVPESERSKFPEDARCCLTCYNNVQDAHFFHLGRVCSDCLLLGYDRATTPGAWKRWRGLHGNTLLCSKCFANKRNERVRRRKGIMKRRKGQKAKGDW